MQISISCSCPISAPNRPQPAAGNSLDTAPSVLRFSSHMQDVFAAGPNYARAILEIGLKSGMPGVCALLAVLALLGLY